MIHIIELLCDGAQGEANFGGEHPKVAAVRAAARERLAKQESEESLSKETLVKNAATYLETFYQVNCSGRSQLACDIACPQLAWSQRHSLATLDWHEMSH